MRIRHFEVIPNIPDRLAHLKDLAMNLWFCWNWDAVKLFIRLDAHLWESCYQNPVLMLGRVPQSSLERAAADADFVRELDRVYGVFTEYQKRQGWFAREHADKSGFLTAYFSCEYGIDEGLPVYSGGLGILSSDHLKSASDLGIPLVGVGLLYQKGYFQQRLNLDGWQQEHYPDNDWYNMPVSIERRSDGQPLKVTVDLAGETVTAQVWRVQVGRVPLYLLDTNISENSAHHREITAHLYGGDRDMRIRQEIVLAVGGVRALAALGLSPTVFHINEGHSAFICLERVRELVRARKFTFDEARELVTASTVFTTHTPVPAGNEVFDLSLVQKYMAPMAAEIGIPFEALAALGHDNGSTPSTTFSMPALALRMSAFSNGVSALHGDVSRSMWHKLWPGILECETPITSVTNGIHTRSWISHDLGELLDQHVGPRLRENPEDDLAWKAVESIPDDKLWHIRHVRRERLVFFVRKRLSADLSRQGAGSAVVKQAESVLEPGILTLGFARRFAAYKRAGLLLSDPDRLARILTSPERPVQIVFSGKAHPADSDGKELIKKIIHFARQPHVRRHIAFIEDYDINVARYLVQGVDVWVNTPIRPLEASGTSGMKAAANGALNLSVMDGWWAEGYSPLVGWSLGERTDYASDAERDRVDSEALYNILELEVVPLFYERDSRGVPARWISMMRHCLTDLAGRFSTHRMVREYTERAYIPSHAASTALARESGAAARDLAKWRARAAAAWSGVSVETTLVPVETLVKAGDKYPVQARVKLAGLAPDDFLVEVVHGPAAGEHDIASPTSTAMRFVESAGGYASFSADVVATQSGRYAFSVRALPSHKSLSYRFLSPPLVTWEP